MKTLSRQALRETIAEMRGWELVVVENGDDYYKKDHYGTQWIHLCDHRPDTDAGIAHAIEALTEWCKANDGTSSLHIDTVSFMCGIHNEYYNTIAEVEHESLAVAVCLALASAHYGEECRLQED